MKKGIHSGVENLFAGEMETDEKTPQQITERNGQSQMDLEDSFEYRFLTSYTKRRVPTHTEPPQSNGAIKTSPVSSKKKRKIFKRIKLLSCILPATGDNADLTEENRLKPNSDASSEKDVEDIVNKVTKITDSVHFLPTDLECDAPDVVDRIVELLREQGDELDKKIKKDHKLMEELQQVLSYSFFKKLTKGYFRCLSPEEVPQVKDPKEVQIALVCEITHRLKIMDRHPMNRVLGFGAKYLQEYYTTWINEQGGYGKVFSTDDDADEEVH
ncbi:apoptosis facilitator Bcl-2-like protein 14 isoform X2 [Hoplias malabaricus]|uniref:apoptosis facilitator Bcl-2-like protein 14 isoform X2 n=1 Tax=Hoplias malabaricus TaxID=27720 RepID=UPI0034627CC8